MVDKKKNEVGEMLDQLSPEQLKEVVEFVGTMLSKEKRSQETDEPVMYSLTECEKILHTTHRTLLSWVTSGYLPAVKIGGRWKITSKDLAAFLKKRSDETEEIVDRTPKYISLTEAANVLEYPFNVVKEWAAVGDLPVIRSGKRVRVPVDEFLDFVNREFGQSTRQSVEYRLEK